MPTPLPRSRGGRGPQVGPGTFEGRTSTASPPAKPEFFEAIVWSAGPGLPAIELWCIHTGGSESKYSRLGYGAAIGDAHTLYLDQVTSAEQFTPPANQPADSEATIAAFREYVVARYAANHDSTTLEHWTVQVGRPFGGQSTNGPNKKIAPGTYSVSEANRPTAATPIAWVRVFDDVNGGQDELWLFWRPGESDGFIHPGTTPTGEQAAYSIAKLQFTRRDDCDAPNDSLSARVASLKDLAEEDENTPVYDRSLLEVHHYRVFVS